MITTTPARLVLPLRWQRLVSDSGQTCQRCDQTAQQFEQAATALTSALAPLGIALAVERVALSPEACAADISESNRIWVGGRPLEEWLAATAGKSDCGFCCEELCGSVECRTVTIGEETYETIPADLIVRAGLLAAAQLLATAAVEPACNCPAAATASPCCPPG